jgi:hypothetical protein
MDGTATLNLDDNDSLHGAALASNLISECASPTAAVSENRGGENGTERVGTGDQNGHAGSSED